MQKNELRAFEDASTLRTSFHAKVLCSRYPAPTAGVTVERYALSTAVGFSAAGKCAPK
jgi:hypothetical protein